MTYIFFLLSKTQIHRNKTKMNWKILDYLNNHPSTTIFTYIKETKQATFFTNSSKDIQALFVMIHQLMLFPSEPILSQKTITFMDIANFYGETINKHTKTFQNDNWHPLVFRTSIDKKLFYNYIFFRNVSMSRYVYHRILYNYDCSNMLEHYKKLDEEISKRNDCIRNIEEKIAIHALIRMSENK